MCRTAVSALFIFKMNFFRNNLANILTLANLFSGSIGVLLLLDGNYQGTAVCIILSLILDFFDGFVARALKSDSNLGTQLDSLADMVSFGLLPGVTMYKMLEPFGNLFLKVELPFDLKYLGLIITVFSCLRLAIFNLDEEQTYYFKGLNTPSNTVLIFGLYYNIQENQGLFLAHNPILLLVLTAVSSWLLIAPVKMISLKFRSMQLKDNYPKVVLALGSLILLAALKTGGIPLVIVFYILVSLLFQKQLR